MLQALALHLFLQGLNLPGKGAPLRDEGDTCALLSTPHPDSLHLSMDEG